MSNLPMFAKHTINQKGKYYTFRTVLKSNMKRHLIPASAI